MQHGVQAFVIFYGVGACLYNDWAIVPTSFILMLATIYFMKMHSYTETNLELYRAIGTENEDNVYPTNLTIGNFVYYMVCPSLVYLPVFPRSNHGFRWGYFIQKMLHLVAAMVLLYVVGSTYIMPVAEKSLEYPMTHAAAKLVVPMLITDMLVFYLLFECICNGLAEITNYGDREFYEDWWNSSTLDEYARKWNRPVHEFLLRHVYHQSIDKFRLSKRDASVAVFLFSALLHELIMSVAFRTLKFYLFVIMILQIPAIQMSKKLRASIPTRLGNTLFWIGISSVVPILTACYAREWAARYGGEDMEYRKLRIF
eukprot:GHVO01012914.1.p1 GENE.GHVO01012914.1~~GHVO01012914.1.p1  ORF type:complete len:352 (-),score=39.86 GHVO01012914.1:203-1141(-)